ncbi:lipopolysaccharide biosynthesis protein [uncultured Duncaniella sp.]|uniref:lipopolysaccharide biosynthesis protein n=1 Tax=uncultured Duncaniella sp. TaxID=2768039 RepID=UPI0025AA1A1F|nr:lipopolysaccharide biosynthesis protein [uncultured Duncaniella sp.]
MSDSLGHKAMKGTVWATVDRIGNMCLQFGVNLVLARLLLPREFGAIGMLEIFIVVSQVLIDGGFAAALIQKKNPTQTDYSTIFYWNIFIAVILYGAIFLCAPFVAEFFNLPLLRNLLRVIGLILITNAFSLIQTNRLRKKLELNKLACANLCAYTISGILAVATAYFGFGVWSLVVLQLGYSTLLAVILWVITGWMPSAVFSRQSLRELFGFGGYLLAATLLQEICKNLQGVIIGKRFSATAMGLYSQASKLDRIASYTLPNILVQVMYPVYASVQDDDERLVNMLGLNTRLISSVIFPLMAVLILVAHPLIVCLWGDAWSACAPYFQILCVGGLFICLQNTNFFAVAAKGKSRLLFYWSIYKWSFLLLCLFVGMNFGIYGLLWGMTLSNFNIFMVNALLASRHTGYKFSMQIGDILPLLSLTIVTFLSTYILENLLSCHFVVTVLIFVAIYIALAYSFNLKVVGEIKMVIMRFLKKQEITVS